MPNQDRQHPIVRRALIKAGWTILREQYFISVSSSVVPARRLYIDLQAQSQNSQIVLIEVKGLEASPVHSFMELVGQYLVYQSALNYVGDFAPLYVAITQIAYQNMIQDALGQEVLLVTLRAPIPFVIYDPIKEEILQWIPPL